MLRDTRLVDLANFPMGGNTTLSDDEIVHKEAIYDRIEQVVGRRGSPTGLGSGHQDS